MLRRYLRKNGVQNTRFFQCFYIQTEVKVNKIQNVLFTNIFNVQNDGWLLWQLHGCYGNHNNCLFQIRRKYDWIFILKEIISFYVSVICVVSYLHKSEEFDHFNPSCSLVFIIAEAAGVHTLLEPLVPQMVWSWNLHQRYSLTKDVDWWRHHFDPMTLAYFTDQKHLCWHQQKLKNYIISQILLSVGLTCDNFKLVSPLDLKIWHSPSFPR